MALKHSGKAFGMVSELVRELLERHHPGVKEDNLNIKVARPIKGGALPLLTLFLYEAHLDPQMRNTMPPDGSASWLWYELHYLMTAFDDSGESDSDKAQSYLSEAARVLQGFGFLPVEGVVPPMDPALVLALRDNPEPLKLTFDDARSDTIARLMQAEDKYHFSLAFQVRPVMIAPTSPGKLSQLVGIDYTKAPNAVIGEAGIQIEVLPSLGPSLEEVLPTELRPGEDLALVATGLAGADLRVWLGELELKLKEKTAGHLLCTVPDSIDEGTSLGAGDHAVRLSLTQAGGRKLWSNAQYVGLLPEVTGLTLEEVAKVNHPITLLPVITAKLTLSGKLLGLKDSEILVGLLREGVLVYSFDSFGFADPNHQQSLTWSLALEDQVRPGTYLLLLRVQGRQARTSVVLNLGP